MKSCRTPIIKSPCTSQWLRQMKEFRQKHEEKCKTVEIPEPSSRTHEFLTGSSYGGEWQEGCGMHGYGVYTFTNGVIYEGEFFEGEFHGKGELQYQTPAGKVIIRGWWHKGLMTERTLLFDGALEHDPQNWLYCKMPDRRFTREYADGVQPGGKSFMTADQPYYVDAPEGYYDTGDGFFNVTRKMIYQHGDYTKILRGITETVRRGTTATVRRGPTLREQKWIQDNCPKGKVDTIIGPRLACYETFVEPTTLLEPVPPPSAKFTTTTRKHSTFEQLEDRNDAPVFYDASRFGADARPPERKFKH